MIPRVHDKILQYIPLFLNIKANILASSVAFNKNFLLSKEKKKFLKVNLLGKNVDNNLRRRREM